MTKREFLCPNRHQFTGEWEEGAPKPLCPKCGEAPLEDGVPLESGPFEDVTAGWETWYDATSAIESLHRWAFHMAVANAIESVSRTFYEAAIGLSVWRGLRNCIPDHLVQKRTVKSREQLRTDLSQFDLAKAAEEMARVSGLLAENERERKAAVAKFKAKDERLCKQLEEISERVRSGETRLVDVITEQDFRTGLVTRIRQDTAEIIEERPLTGAERQQGFFDQEQDAKAPDAAPEAQEEAETTPAEDSPESEDEDDTEAGNGPDADDAETGDEDTEQPADDAP